MCDLIWWTIANKAMLVFPAPVGAQISMFSLVWYATGNTSDCILLNSLMSLNTRLPVVSKLLTFTKSMSSLLGLVPPGKVNST